MEAESNNRHRLARFKYGVRVRNPGDGNIFRGEGRMGQPAAVSPADFATFRVFHDGVNNIKAAGNCQTHRHLACRCYRIYLAVVGPRGTAIVVAGASYKAQREYGLLSIDS